MCETPPRSPTMVGIAVETMVWSSAAMSMPASSAEKMRLTRRLVSTIGDATSGSGACTEFSRGRATVPRVRGTGGADGVVRSECRSGRRRREPRLEDVPGVVDEVGQGGGEVGGVPPVEGDAHGGATHRGQQAGV